MNQAYPNTPGFVGQVKLAVRVEPVVVTVAEIGQALMTRYVLPLEIIAVLLTAAMIGAVIVAMHEKEGAQ